MKTKQIVIGLTASLILLVLYFAVLSLANSFSHAITLFLEMWYWILILVIGFGLQVGLYFYIRASIREKQIKNPTAAVVASGGISTGSMIACCLHHLVDVLPILGLAALAVFLAQYQLFFIIFGVLANIIGIIIMLEIIQKHKLSEGVFKRILVYNMNKVKKIAIVSSFALLLLTFFITNNQGNANILTTAVVSSGIEIQKGAPDKVILLSKTDSQGGITFKVTPLNFNFDQPISFKINIDTHSGSLDFDLIKAAILQDDKGNKYQASSWQGSPSGGHHRSGILLFPKLDARANKLKLVIKYVSVRVFEWDLK